MFCLSQSQIAELTACSIDDLQVDFPIEGLDMAPYLAPSAVAQYESLQILEDTCCVSTNAREMETHKEGEEEVEVVELHIPEEQEELEEQLRKGVVSHSQGHYDAKSAIVPTENQAPPHQVTTLAE